MHGPFLLLVVHVRLMRRARDAVLITAQRSPTQSWQSMHGRCSQIDREVLIPEAKGAQEAVIAAM